MPAVYPIKMEVHGDLPPANGKGLAFRGTYILPELAMRLLDLYANPCGISAQIVMRVLNKSFHHGGLWPWTIIFWPGDYYVSGHIAWLRGVMHNMPMHAYSRIYNQLELIPDNGTPPVSIVRVRAKGVLQAVAAQSPILFGGLWDVLKEHSSSTPWCVFADTPPTEWLTANEHRDDALYEELSTRESATHIGPLDKFDNSEAEESFKCANHYIKEDNYDAAISCLRTVVKRKPDSAHAWCLLGALLKTQGAITESMVSFETTLKIMPYWTQVWQYMADICMQTNRYGDAVTFLKSALDIDPFDETTLRCMADMAMNLNKNEEACGYFERYLSLAVHDCYGWMKYGCLLYRMGRVREGAQACIRAIKSDPEDSRAWNNAGYMLARAGDFEKAYRYCKKALKMNPNRVTHLDSMGYVLLSKGNYEEAIPFFLKAIEVDPKHGESWRHLMQLYHQAGMKDKFMAIASYMEKNELVCAVTQGLSEIHKGVIT